MANNKISSSQCFNIGLVVVFFLAVWCFSYISLAAPLPPTAVNTIETLAPKSKVIHNTRQEETIMKDAEELGRSVQNDKKNNLPKIVGGDDVTNYYVKSIELYYQQTVNFYQTVLTFLIGIIACLAFFGFLFMRFVSKLQAEEMAYEVLEKETFKIRLGNIVETKVEEIIRSEDIDSKLSELSSRINFLEKEKTEQSYVIKEKDEKGGS